MRQPARPVPRPSNPANTNGQKCAVLVDGSALYLGARGFYEGRPLDYHALGRVLTSEIPGLRLPVPGRADSLWVMWTSASPQNAGQSRFLEFAENELHWSVRRFNPADSFMVEPSTILGLSSESRAAGRLIRFDASIAFAIGRLAGTHRIVVLTDSFSLADPLLKASQVASSPERCPVLAFFGRGLDSRWQGFLRKSEGALRFIDLDDFEDALFGSKQQEVKKPVTFDDSIVF